jgi:hypothetical protein
MWYKFYKNKLPKENTLCILAILVDWRPKIKPYWHYKLAICKKIKDYNNKTDKYEEKIWFINYNTDMPIQDNIKYWKEIKPLKIKAGE